MAIKRFTAIKDNTITNAFKAGNRTRGTSANMGASDIVEVFSIYAQASTSSLEQSRILIDFPIDKIIEARSQGEILPSGSVSFRLKLFNAPHSQTTPSSFSISLSPVSSSWSEGSGLDMEEYSDLGSSSWLSSSIGTAWTNPGGDYISNYTSHVFFDTGLEDLDVDVTSLVESWIDNTVENHGLILKLSGSAEDGTAEKSYYTKRFFARNSEFFMKRPVIEAQQSKIISDDRGNLFKSSPLVSSEDNLNSIYFYNNHGGTLSDIPDTGSALVVQLFSTLGDSAETVSGENVNNNYITATRFSKGIYEAKFSYSGDSTVLHDVWQVKNNENYQQIYSGSAMPVSEREVTFNNSKRDYVLKVTNLKETYLNDEVETLRVFTKEKNKSPNVYTKSTGKSTISTIEDLFYKIVRVSDNYEVVPYSTSSAVPFSKLSYDSEGSFFDLDMSILEPNYLYEISFLRKENTDFVEQKEKFRFRVES